MNKLMKKLIKSYVLAQLPDLTSRRSKNTLALAAAGVGAAVLVHSALRQRNRFDLRGKTVLITGGSRGLGLVLAREFQQEGAHIAICARDAEELKRAESELTARGGQVLAIPCDVTMPFEVETMIQTVSQRFGQIDVLVNNAGIMTVGPIEEMTLSDFQDAMQTNYQAALYTTLAVLPEMRARQAGRIINIASIGGKISVPHMVPYSVSKHALVALSEGLRAEVKKDGILVTTVCPGLMRTGSPLNANFKGQNQAEYAWFSISDALPFISMSANNAARRIVSACQQGEAEVILSVPAKLAAALHGVCPGFTTDLLGLINSFLPAPGGIGTEAAKGKDSESSLSPSWVTTLSNQAAQENNQIH